MLLVEASIPFLLWFRASRPYAVAMGLLAHGWIMAFMTIPVFGLLANLGCMAFYLVGPFMGFGTVKEPLLALGIAMVWALYGGIYFLKSSKATGRTTMVTSRAGATGLV